MESKDKKRSKRKCKFITNIRNKLVEIKNVIKNADKRKL